MDFRCQEEQEENAAETDRREPGRGMYPSFDWQTRERIAWKYQKVKCSAGNGRNRGLNGSGEH